MPDIIHLLPDSVANQIAAGEVIQRPASVVKELVENAIDAGSTKIKILIKDGGKTLVQVIDNGCGMSLTDARIAFERHATSKIKSADDLFTINTMGFRGEALAAIAAVAQVELKTRLKTNELGTLISIAGSEVIEQVPVQFQEGTMFSVKNLFFNVPARRKFLKNDNLEFSHILQEFNRISLAYPDVEFSLFHNNSNIHQLPPSKIKQRIIHLFGKNFNQSLVAVLTNNDLIKIYGYISKPEFAKKKQADQYFFVNKRFIKHPYFHKAIMKAYEMLIPPDANPSYFIYFDIDPGSIDINIHPTKTEIKFENASTIFSILYSVVKESLGKFNLVPSIDFDQEGAIEIPVLTKETEIRQPEIRINPEYNPFMTNKSFPKNFLEKTNLDNWEKLYENFESRIDSDEASNKDDILPQDTNFNINGKSNETGKQGTVLSNQNIGLNILQLKNRFIVTPVKSGLMIIDQKRAHERILFEKYLEMLENKVGLAQTTLFPQTIQLDTENTGILMEIKDEINLLGFDIREFGKDTFVINAIPAELIYDDPKEWIEVFIDDYKNTIGEIKSDFHEHLAVSFAKVSSIPYEKALKQAEMKDLIDKLFACKAPNYSPDGKCIISIIELDEIVKKF